MNVTLARRYRIESARRLPRLPPEHPCASVHGHGFEVEIEVSGPLDPEMGWLIDYAAMDEAWREVHRVLDHAYLNDVDGLENPTSELISVFIWRRLAGRLIGLSSVSVMETPTTRATYRGP